MTAREARVLLLTASLMTACALGAIPIPAVAQSPTYTIVDLGTLGGASSTSAALNDAGVVVGNSDTTIPVRFSSQTARHAFIWDATNGLRDFNALSGKPAAQDTFASDINAKGQVAGSDDHVFEQNSLSDAFAWDPNLGFLAGCCVLPDRGTRVNSALAINAEAQVVGKADELAFFFSPTIGTMRLLPPGQATFSANDINDSGQVVGSALGSATPKAYVWSQAGGFVDLGVLPGQSASAASSINNHGQVVGESGTQLFGSADLFVWQAGTGMRDLGSGSPSAINDLGQIVGIRNGQPVMWDQTGGVLDLNGALPTNSGWILQTASDINVHGQIVGGGLHNGQRHAYLMTPAPVDADLVLSQPPNLTANATSPRGAAVTYALPTVTDEDTTRPTPICTPTSGSTFAIGTTAVTCTVMDSDDANSPVQTTFTVHVKGAAEQLGDLHVAVEGVGPGSSLADKVTEAEAFLAAGNVGDTCGTLGAFIHEVHAQTGKSITTPEAQTLDATVTRIEAVLSCG